MNKKKILVVTTTDNMIWQFLIPHIKHLEEQGNIVECVCANTGFFFDELKNKFNINLHEINFSRFPFTLKNFKGLKKLKNLFKEKKYDLIYCHQPVGGVMGRIIGKIFKKPVVYVAHGFHFFKKAPIINNVLYKTIEKHYSKFTDALVTMNEEDFVNAKKFKAKKVYKISGIGLDLNKYKNEEIDINLKKELNINKNDVVVLSVGELNKNKNLETTIKAFEFMKKDNIKYLICGQGPLKQKFENLIKEKKLKNNIKLLGFRSDITKIYNLADIFVMPSFREGLPKSMMEAMAYGLPVVCSNIRGCCDLIKENEGGFLLKPKDIVGFKNTIEKLAQDKNLRLTMGNKNKENIKDYSIQKVLLQMDEVFKGVNLIND